MVNKLKKGLLGLAAVVALAGVFSLNSCSDKKSDSRNSQKRQEIVENGNDVFAKYIAQFEGRKNRVYDPMPNDGKPEPTIGIGHYLDRGDSRETFARVLPDVNYDSIYTGKSVLTDSQIDKLFAEDLIKYVERAKSLVPTFDNFPVTVQTALVDMAYRGDLGDSPRMRSLLNTGKVREASNEYINRAEYRNADKKGVRGVKTRMDSNRKRLIDYASQLETTNSLK